MLLTIVSFLLILTVLVLIHEAGHFFTAKFFGVKVEEFGFGFPPRAWGRKIGETIYSLNWLPIGGFVKLFGEDEAGGGKLSLPASSKIKKNSSVRSGENDLKRAFFTQNVWKRFLIVFAGVFMNFFLATVILTYLVGVQGVPAAGTTVTIVAVEKNSPAESAGLKTGDVVEKVDGQTVISTSQLINYTRTHEGRKVVLTVLTKDKKSQTVSLIPRLHPKPNEGAMGVAIEQNTIVKTFPWYLWPYVGLREALSQSWMIIVGLWGLVTQLVTKAQVPQDLAGPVGIAQLTGQFVQMGFNATLSLLALLSLNLAILNILPIPALDGGRIFFILFEAVTKRKISSKAEGYVHTAGMVFLFALIILITFHDIMRLATGGSLLPR